MPRHALGVIAHCDSASRSEASVTRLLCTTGLVAVAMALLAVLAPVLAVSASLARLLGIALAIGALLLTAWAAPSEGARRTGWLVGLSTLYAFLFLIDLGSMTPALLCLLTLLVLTTAGIVGGYIGSLLEYPGMLLVVSYVAALADCCSVFHPDGLTAQVLKHPKTMALLTLSVPVLGSAEIHPVVGIGDVVFVALFVAGARVTGLDTRRTLIALGVALAAVAVVTELSESALPALPFLGGAVLLAHPEARRVPAAHTRRVGLNLAVVTLVMGGMLWSAATQPREVEDGEAVPGAASTGDAASERSIEPT